MTLLKVIFFFASEEKIHRELIIRNVYSREFTPFPKDDRNDHVFRLEKKKERKETQTRPDKKRPVFGQIYPHYSSLRDSCIAAGFPLLTLNSRLPRYTRNLPMQPLPFARDPQLGLVFDLLL